MTDPRYRELESRGTAGLRNPERIQGAPRIGTRSFLIQFRHEPAFGPWCTWTAYSPWKNQDDRALVRRVVWEQLVDQAAFADPLEVARRVGSAEPTLAVTDAPLKWDEVEKWRTELAGIQIPLIKSASFGTDGETFGIRYGGHSLEMNLQWWGDGPKEWRGLVEFFHRALKQLEDLFAQR